MSVLTANNGAMSVNMNPVGDTWRGAFSSDFNSANIAREDWQRAEQAQNNQLARDLYFQEHLNAFNSAEAQKDRDWQERMSSTSYTRAVQDLKNAGLNPILAYSNGGASTPAGGQASSSGARSSSSNSGKGKVSDTDTAGFINTLAGLASLGSSIALGGVKTGMYNDFLKDKLSAYKDYLAKKRR